MIKSLTVKHIKKKSNILTVEQLKQILKDGHDEYNPQELEKKIAISLLYYGLLGMEGG